MTEEQLRKDSPITRLRLTISTELAKELIVKLELEPMSGGFKSATTWKRVKDWNALLATN